MTKKTKKSKKNYLGLTGVIECSPSYTKSGVIQSISHDSDGRNVTPYININYDDYGVQGFGGLCCDKDAIKKFNLAICRYFDVTKLEELKGRKCAAVFNQGGYGELIKGIMNPAFPGTAFILDKWREDVGFTRHDTVENAIASAEVEIARLEQRIKDLKNKKLKLLSEFDEIY